MKLNHPCILAITFFVALTSANADTPSFDCAAKKLSTAERLICSDRELMTLDRELHAVFLEALPLDARSVGGSLKVEQRGWVKGRNDCWKESDLRACLVDSYLRRTAELQAKYRLLSPTSTVFYACNGNPAHELIVHFFATKLKSAVAEHGDDTFILFDDSRGGGEHYTGRNETLTVKDAGVEFVAEYQGPTLTCLPRGETPRKMHPSWDRDRDGVNDCEREDRCDDSVNYTKPRT